MKNIALKVLHLPNYEHLVYNVVTKCSHLNLGIHRRL